MEPPPEGLRGVVARPNLTKGKVLARWPYGSGKGLDDRNENERNGSPDHPFLT